MKNKKLLFFFSDEKCSACSIVVPTLSALAEEMGMDFESYICSRPESWQGKVLPTVGHSHLESFYYLANFYEEILYCSISSYGSYQFRREVLAFGGKVISERKNHEVIDFYNDVYGFFSKSLPNTVVVIPDFDKDKKHNISPYCYPDIMRLNAIGINESIWKDNENYIRDNIQNVYSLYCDIQGATVIDSFGESDNFASVTERIAQRNIENALQIGFIDPNCLLRWQTMFCRKKIIAMYENYEWADFIPTVKKYADVVNNSIVPGTQVVFNEAHGIIRNNDAVIAELGKYSLIHDLLGVNPRIGFSIQTEHQLPLDWMEDEEVPTPWDDEYSDEFLIQKIEERAVPVCFMFYAADLGHLPVLPNFLNLMCLDGMRGGIAFPSTWYDYHPELVEELYIPLEQGGVCPNLEPVLSSLGVAVGTEAEGYIKPEFLKTLITKAKKDIEKACGKRRVPRGYYPFQDSNPYYRKNEGKPQYDTISELGFDYYVTCKHGEESAQIIYEKNGMTVINRQIKQWFPGGGKNPLNFLKLWEEKCEEKRKKWENGEPYDEVDWIMFSFDTPFFALTPNYLGDVEYEVIRTTWGKCCGMHYIYEAMQYVRRTGGKDGKLFLAKPNEVYRFAKLAKERGIVKENFEN